MSLIELKCIWVDGFSEWLWKVFTANLIFVLKKKPIVASFEHCASFSNIHMDISYIIPNSVDNDQTVGHAITIKVFLIGS